MQTAYYQSLRYNSKGRHWKLADLVVKTKHWYFWYSDDDIPINTLLSNPTVWA